MTVDLLTVTVGALSCVVFVLIVVLLVLIYRKGNVCCRYRSSQNAPLHYHSRDTLIGCAQHEDTAASNLGIFHEQPQVGPFIIGKPSDYHLRGEGPRLPSYDSVRKRDRQRHIHFLIAQRFGLGGSQSDCEPPPPSYEESIRQSVDLSQLDLRHPADGGLPTDQGCNFLTS